MGSVAAFFTAFYMFRLVYLTFYGKFRGTKAQEHHLHESPKAMTVPLVVLAILSAVGGYIGLPHALGGHNRFGQWLEPVIRHGAVIEGAEVGEVHDVSVEYMVMAISVLIALAGIFLAYQWYMKKSTTPKALAETPLYRVLLNKYGVDQFYDRAISQPFVRLSELLAQYFDQGTIDGFINGTATFFGGVGQAVRRAQTGIVQNYALFMGIGLLAILTTFLVVALGK